MTEPVSETLQLLREAADMAREAVEDFRNVTVTIRTITWSGTRVGEGEATIVDDTLPRRFPVEHAVKGRNILGSGGRYEAEDLMVKEISPPYDGGGFTPERLDPAAYFDAGVRNKEVLYLLSGDTVGVYSLVALHTHDPVEWDLVIRRTRRSP